MNIDLQLNDFSLPMYIKRDNEYYCNLKGYFERYLKHIERVSGISKECKERIENNCEVILQSILQYYDANIIKAEQCIEKILERYLDSAFLVASINDNYAFKGLSPKKIRPSICNESHCSLYEEMTNKEFYFFRSRISVERLERKDMLHIPFDNRGCISTQRFSIPGTPCLYFSTTTLGTWLEMGMPDINVFQAAAYELPKELKVLNLCLQQFFLDGSSSLISTEQEYKNIHDFLEIFPLVIASSYRIGECNRVFKSEYVIPQLIMQAARCLGIDGVAYLTKRMCDSYSYPHGVNLALMMPCNGKVEEKYWERASEIKLTSPYFITDIQKKNESIYNSFINKYYGNHIQGKIQIFNNTFKYTELNFSDFDEFLWMEAKEPFTG